MKVIRKILCVLLVLMMCGCTSIKKYTAYTIYPIGYLLNRIGGNRIETISIQNRSLIQCANLVEDYNEILSLIIEEKIDCGFLPRTVVKDSLAFYPLLNDRLFALLPPEHPLAKEKAVSLDDFLSYPLIIQSFGDVRRRTLL